MSSSSLGAGLALAWHVQKQISRIFSPSKLEGDSGICSNVMINEINAFMVNLDITLPPL